MAGLQRSSISFRRQGSSGLVWDDRALAGDLDDQMMKQKEEGTEPKELRTSRSIKAGRTRVDQLSVATKLDRSHSAGGGGSGSRRGGDFQRKRMVLPDIGDPPSPKVSCCSFCSVSRKSEIDNLVAPGKRKS